jgi:hypothetical protein
MAKNGEPMTGTTNVQIPREKPRIRLVDWKSMTSAKICLN